jgi:hypothetical protein
MLNLNYLHVSDNMVLCVKSLHQVGENFFPIDEGEWYELSPTKGWSSPGLVFLVQHRDGRVHHIPYDLSSFMSKEGWRDILLKKIINE